MKKISDFQHLRSSSLLNSAVGQFFNTTFFSSSSAVYQINRQNYTHTYQTPHTRGNPNLIQLFLNHQIILINFTRRISLSHIACQITKQLKQQLRRQKYRNASPYTHTQHTNLIINHTRPKNYLQFFTPAFHPPIHRTHIQSRINIPYSGNTVRKINSLNYDTFLITDIYYAAFTFSSPFTILRQARVVQIHISKYKSAK